MKNIFLLGLLSLLLSSCNNQPTEVVTPAVDTVAVDSVVVEQPLDSIADSVAIDTVKVSK